MNSRLFEEQHLPDREMNESEKRWLSWSILSTGFKHSYQGTVSKKVIATRRAKNKVAKASRKANRG